VIVCAAANPSIDRLFEVEQLRPGEVHRPALHAQVAGGKGLNAARAAAALGGDVRVVAILAGHAGRWLEHELGREGIPVESIWVDGESRSSLSVADQAGAGLTEFYEDGVAITADAWRRFAAHTSALSRSAAWVTISGSLPPGAPAEGYARLDLDCAVAADTVEARPASADLVKVNAPEAARLTGLQTGTTEGALAAARALRGGDGTGAVTRGPAGAVLVTADGAALTGTLDAPGRYPVGSGDSFLAGLVVGRAAGAGWDDALRLALGAAAANAAVPGAARFARADAERLAELAVVSRA
jgi:1-phosphofructokinase family hexose kinase